ncbi:MAG TPA: S9 family peptidase [Tissierellaceae bacterium]
MQNKKEKIVATSVLEHNYIYDLEMSKDEKYLVFRLGNMDIEKNGYNSEIYLYNIEKEEYILLPVESSKINKMFFENNDKLVFIKNNKDNSVIEKYDYINQKSIEEITVPVKINNISKIDEDNYLIYSTILTVEDTETDAYNYYTEAPFWGDAVGITNGKRKVLSIFNIKTNDLDQITNTSMDSIGATVSNGKIAYIGKTIKGNIKYTNGIYEYDIDTKQTKQLVDEDTFNISRIQYLNDELIILANDLKEYGTKTSEEFFKLVDGEMVKQTNFDFTYNTAITCDIRYKKSTTNRVYKDRMYFTITDNYSSQIYSVDSNLNIKTHSDHYGSYDGYVIAEDFIIFIGVRGVKLQEIYMIKDEEVRQISKFNEKYCEDKDLREIEKFVFNSNGDDITGFVIKPSDYDENKQYPGILIIHGGPYVTYGDVYHHDMQFLANQGYFVFYTNPHGAAGRGGKFADIRGEFGYKDYQDLMNFTDQVIFRYPNIDVNRLGVTGGSYGGYMTNWIIGHTDRFKCAISEKSISNFTTKLLATDIGWNVNKEQPNATPWSNYDKLWDHSPLKYANKAKTPTLFIHGEKDHRCWISESIQMYSAMKYHDVEAEMLVFKGESHAYSIIGKPANKVKRLEVMKDWFDKKLK